MSELTPEKRAKLRAKAEAATPGPRTWSDHIAPYISIRTQTIRISEPFYRDGSGGAVKEADFIAAFDRETCLSLLDAADERDRLRSEVERVTDIAAMKAESWEQRIAELEAEVAAFEADRVRARDILVALSNAIRPDIDLTERGVCTVAEAEAIVAENKSLRKSLSNACSDWTEDDDDLHARCDAILGPEVLLPGYGRTPVAGDDGRVAEVIRKLQAAVKEEREACAAIADSHNGVPPGSGDYDRGWSRGAFRIAEAIRARGQSTEAPNAIKRT